jgi:threonine aldolase
MDLIDLRSDTLTKPSPGMRQAMANAEVGDDQYGEDPTVNALQERIAALLGKEAALFMPSGTMANQVGIKLLTNHGDEVIVGNRVHIALYESGGAAANSGVQLVVAGTKGTFTLEEFRLACRYIGDDARPPTTLVCIENTHNRGGGVVFPQHEVVAICDDAHERGMRAYLDGMRLFNAAAATNHSVKELAAPFDVVSIALSKGLGCPVGSVIAGSKADMARAHRIRRRFGGAMRQSGILAAAGLYALDHNVTRLKEDHANARVIAETIAGIKGVDLDLSTVQTNIVIWRLEDGMPAPETVAARAREEGVLVSPFSTRTVRAVTHLDVTAAQCKRAAEVLARVLERG